MKHRGKSLLALLLVLAVGTPLAAWAAEPERAEKPAGSAAVTAQALAQMGYTEQPDEFTKFGQWGGYPHGYWCDMFVSWCAGQAGVPQEVFPHNISCTSHVRQFRTMGCYEDSAARGGAYTPRQGDVIFFWNPESGKIYHVGLVLYVERGTVFSIEGNALTNRTDYSAEALSQQRKDSLEPCDYVTVNRYPLDSSRIHGYGVPAYGDRTPLELEGYVDLPPDSALRQPLERLTAEGLMPGVSSHTFAPRDGMSRGAFLEQVLRLLGLSGWKAGTAHFADGTMDSPYYSALMTARSAGLIDGGVDNRFYPERFLSGEEAQELLSQALAWAGLEDRRFSFGPGDLDYLPGPYASRADLALALYAAAECLPLSQEFLGEITWEDQALDWPARTLEEGDCWAALDHLLAAFPDQFSPGLPETEVPASAAGDQVFRTALVLREGTEAVDAFFHSGTLYVNLEQAAALLPEGLAIRREGP